MPCYRCGARQSDPARGANLWVRGVRADEQVLVCPDCQQTKGWSSGLDHCPVCNATTLVRRLGQTVCRSCEASATAEFLAVETTMDRGFAVRMPGPGRHRRTDGRDLSADVASAIDRVLGRGSARPASPGDAARPDGARPDGSRPDGAQPDGGGRDAPGVTTQEQRRVPPDGAA
ncbi:hypothetical protein [Jiangella gansuensis]|uniref:hypothetical protein n=1 Tax=Jiangella gansuensis TaxID=281473 RepID=UPI0006882208|nr:hypothetical protein [Jiangella gansuensis]